MRDGMRPERKGARTDGAGPWRPLRDLAFSQNKMGAFGELGAGQIMQVIPGI